MDNEKRQLFEFFTLKNKAFKAYVQKRIQSLGDMDAEDIVEEVMISMLGSPDSSLNMENLAAYIYRSLHNRAIDYHRKNRHTISLYSFMDDKENLPLLSLLPGGAGVSGELERKDLLQRLSGAVSSLEPKQRAVFIATEMKGRSFRELSEEWNEPVGTLLSRKCRAVKALREMLKDIRNEED